MLKNLLSLAVLALVSGTLLIGSALATTGTSPTGTSPTGGGTTLSEPKDFDHDQRPTAPAESGFPK